MERPPQRKEQLASQRVEIITEEVRREAYGYEEERKPTFRAILRQSLRCSKSKALRAFPFIKWVMEYDVRNDLLRDMFAGLTVAVMHIPHGLAYAPLGRVEPVVGFYMAVFPVLIYFFLGTSRHISLGTFAIVCAMVGEVIQTHTLPAIYLESDPDIDGGVNGSSKAVHKNIEVAAAMCLMVGSWQLALGLLQMGTLNVVMSESLVSGYTAGAAVHVCSYQLKNLFGSNIGNHSGLFKLFHIYVDFFRTISNVNLVTMSISIICITILLFFNEYIKVILQKKFPNNKFPFPMELLLIVLGILLSYLLNLSERYGVSIVSHIPTGFPAPLVPPPDLFIDLLQESLVVAAVILSVNISLARIFAKQGFYKVSGNHELIAYGAANIFASFFRCLPSAASLSRSAMQFKVGGKSQVASLFSMFLIIGLLLFAAPVFEPVPYCVLSSIVIVTLKSLLMQITEFPTIWRQSTWNGIVWLGTFCSVVILDLSIGLLVGIILSLLRIIFHMRSFTLRVLGRVPNSDVYLSVDHYTSSHELPNILILEIDGSINFINAGQIEHDVQNRFHEARHDEFQLAVFLIIDMTCVPKVDPSGVMALRSISKSLQRVECELYLTNCNIEVYDKLHVCGAFKDIPKEHILASVANAVDYLNARLSIR